VTTPSKRTSASETTVAATLCAAVAACGIAAMASARPDMPASGGGTTVTMTYEVTITNLTKGQPLSPPVIFTHPPTMHAWREGELAGPEVEMVAEQGKTEMLVKMLAGKATDVKAAKMDDKIKPGQSMTMRVTAKPGDVLSAVTMLAATNDGFTGLDACPLGGESMVTREAMAYDAGTEQNSEKHEDVPAPKMGRGGTPTSPPQPVSMHRGITGTGDLDPDQMGWTGPVARFEIKRM